jgi:hypothetical protein
MGKALSIIGVIAVILIAGIAIWAYTVPAATTAIVYIESGDVEVNLGPGWSPAQDEMILSQGNKVRTGEGKAAVVLLSGEVIHLEPNTEITLQEIQPLGIRIRQAAGETWNKVTRISGISSYEVETPTTVATVRGTEFFIGMDAVTVGEGEVEAGFTQQPSKKLVLRTLRKATFDPEKDLTDVQVLDDPRLQEFREIYIQHLQRTRKHELNKHEMLLKIAKTRYEVTDAQIDQFLEDLDEGRRDADKIYEQVPGPFKRKLERVYRLTKEIQRAHEMLG